MISDDCKNAENFKSIAATNSSITLIWNGTATEYAVVVKTNETKPNESENGLTITGHFAEYKSLTPGTKYYAFIRAICSATDKSEWSNGITFETTVEPKNGDISDANYTLPPSLQIGVGIGPNFSGQNWEYYISPLDNTLKRDYLTDVSMVASVIVSYTPKFNYVKTRQVTNPKSESETRESKTIAEPIPNSDFKAPGWFTILGSFNLGQVNTSIGFNTRLSGGIGMGVNIQNTMQIGLFCDFTQVRVLRSNYKDSLDKQLLINNIPVTALDQSDNRFFKNSTQPSFSIKFIYLLSKRKGDIETGLSHEANIEQK